MPRIRPYFSARKTVSPTLSPDGRLAFLTDVTGTNQVWTLDSPAEWPEQRTFYDERVSALSWAPDGERLLFAKDAGADEHHQLFTLDPADGTIEQLTDRPDAIHGWGGWHPDGDRIAFSANRRDSSDFDVHVMALDDAEPRLVSEGDGTLGVEGWGPDGEQLLVRTAHGSTDDDLYVLDVDTGERSHVTPGDEARYRHPTFGPDGEGVYCLSDANADTKELVRIDRSSLAIETVESGDGWPIDQLAVATGSGRLALTRNVDGYADCHVGRLAAPAEVATTGVDLPDGVVHDLTFGPGGERLAVTVSTPTLNHSVFVVDPDDVAADGTPAIERWTEPSTGGLSVEGFARPDLVRYGTFDDRKIPAYVTFPEGVSRDDEASVPVVVDIHGGPHHQRRPWFRPIRQYFLDAGYAVFEPNVRGSSGYGREYATLDDVEKRMDSVADVAAAVDWLAAQPAVDPESVVAYGRSYGGFMVLAVLTEYPDLWAAGVEFVGIANWVTFLENTGDWRRSHRESEYGSLAEDRELLERISPIHDVDAIDCPLFIQHGENDPRVPVAEARQIAEAVQARGNPVETCIFEDEGHHTTKLENRIEQFERIGAFLDEHVGEPTAGVK